MKIHCRIEWRSHKKPEYGSRKHKFGKNIELLKKFESMQSQTFSFNSLKISRFPKNEKHLDSCILIWKEYFDDYQIKTKYLTYKAY